MKGSDSAPPGRFNTRFPPERPINGASLWKWRSEGRNDGAFCPGGFTCPRATPAKDAGSHLPTATATAVAKSGQTAKPAAIARYSRFLCRTLKPKGFLAHRTFDRCCDHSYHSGHCDSELTPRTHGSQQGFGRRFCAHRQYCANHVSFDLSHGRVRGCFDKLRWCDRYGLRSRLGHCLLDRCGSV